MKSFKNQVVWITGASSGIGEALAYELSQQGAKLILSARRKEELERVKGQCPAHAQPQIEILPLDLEQASTLPIMAAAAQQLFGRIDMLIHSGGISQRSPAIDTLVEVDRKIMEVNYFSAVALTKAVLPGMVKQGGGHIVAISSLVGKFGTPGRSAYAASKHALHGFFDSLRAEVWDKGIKVSLICPGFVKTHVTYNALTATGEKLNIMGDAHSKSMTAAQCARRIAKALKRGKQEAYIAGKEKWGVVVKRLFPRLFSKLIRTAKVT
jgi:short-subunit dehydrogenase